MKLKCSTLSTLRIFYTPHFPHPSFSTPRTPHPALLVFHRTIHYLCFCETIELRKQHIENLSDTQLTTEQINLLSRGLKFIPTPVMKRNQIRRQLISDFNQFARRMRLQYIYHDENTEQHPFHVKSSWIPPIQRSVSLETYLEEVKIKLAELHWLNLKIICHPASNELSRSLLTTKKLFSKKQIKAQQPSS